MTRSLDISFPILSLGKERGGSATRLRYAVGVCDDGAGARCRLDAGAGGAGGGAGGLTQLAGRGKHAVGVCDDGAGARCGLERECCLLVLNLVSSTLPCIRQPRPRLRVLDVCGFV